MPAVSTVNPLLAKVGGQIDKAIKEHAGAEPDVGGQMRLPPGIPSGVAQVVKVTFGEYKSGPNKDKLYCLFQAAVHTPKKHVHNGQEYDLAGAQMTKSMPICETRTQGNPPKVTTIQQNAQIVEDWMKTFGIDKGLFAQGFTALETGAKLLTQVKPFFRFSTQVKPGVKNPDGTTKYEEGVWENWHGRVDDFNPEDHEAPAIEETATAESGDGGKDGGGSQTAAGGEYRDDADLDSLVERAKDDSADKADDSAEATERLTEMAKAAGYSDDDIQAAAGWDEVKELILNPKTADEGAAPSEPEEFKPVKGNVYDYYPFDPKTKKPAKKPTEVEVLSVDPKTETATLKDLTTKRTVTDPKTKAALKVQWSELKNKE